jgi:predicted DNA-binding WGR domain protein
MNTEKIKDFPAGALRHFQLSDGKSEKFWEIRVSESGFEVRFGKIGTAGQTQTKAFSDAATTIKKVEHLIAEKLGKGYVELSQSSSLDSGADEAGEGQILASGESKVAKASSNAVTVDGLSTSEMVELASNPSLTSKQLASLVAQHFEVNRVIAKHQNATAGMLRQIAEHWDDELNGRDEEAQRLIAQHPKTPVDLLTRLGHAFPSELLRNPALKALLLKKPTFLDQFSGLVRLPDCPESYLRAIATGEADLSKLDMLRNPNLPADLRTKLTPDYFNRRALDKLQAFAAEQKDVDGRNYVEAYARHSQSYCIPSFVPLDRSNRHHRLDDQAMRGFPFTSANWPWPLTDAGQPMQPLAQIDLEKAGILLGTELGRGLLQVWAMDTNEPLLRTIPPSALEDDLDTYYPNEAFWNVECGDTSEYVGLFYLYLSQMPHPRIEWIRAGQMFPRPLQAMWNWCEENTNFRERKQEQLSERIEDLGIPMMERGDSATRWVHLGGYPGGHGNQGARCDWHGEEERLLLYVRDGGEDVVFTMQVTVSLGVEGKPNFQAYITCDN